MENSAEQWFYIQGGDRKGPVSLLELKEMYKNSGLSEQALVWTKNFGDDWKRLEDVAEMREANEPPLVPAKSISNLWLYLLVAVPIFGVTLETVMTESYPEWFLQGSDSAGFIIFFVLNSAFGLLDEREIRKSGRKDIAKGIMAWIFLFVPIYIFFRGKRTGKGAWPLLGWISALLIGVFAEESIPSEIYLGVGVPSCESKTTIGMIEKIYPEIPINVVNATVVDISEIRETGYDKENKIRSCNAIVKNSIASDTPILIKISEVGDEYYFEVQFSY